MGVKYQMHCHPHMWCKGNIIIGKGPSDLGSISGQGCLYFTEC